MFLSIIVASGLTMVTVYNSIVDARSWNSDIPTSIQAARDYYKHVDPRLFFLIIGPPNFLLSILTLILFWKDGVTLRVYFTISLVCYVAIVVLTLTYFVPRDLIIFTWPLQDHLNEISAAAAQWNQMNWIRTLLGLVGVLGSFKGLDTYYRVLSK